jgi:trehalose/maltose hydrolase-like predicted phosphorylase
MADGVTREHSTYNGENIKQADVNLLAFPLKTIKDNAQITKDLLFYQSRIPNSGTPAMTYSIFTILYSRLQDSTNSYKFFTESFQ